MVFVIPKDLFTGQNYNSYYQKNYASLSYLCGFITPQYFNRVTPFLKHTKSMI